MPVLLNKRRFRVNYILYLIHLQFQLELTLVEYIDYGLALPRGLHWARFLIASYQQDCLACARMEASACIALTVAACSSVSISSEVLAPLVIAKPSIFRHRCRVSPWWASAWEYVSIWPESLRLREGFSDKYVHEGCHTWDRQCTDVT